jgi:hypothetical protein
MLSMRGSDEDDAAVVDEDERRSPVASKPRAVVQIVACERKVVGEGFAVWRSIGR